MSGRSTPQPARSRANTTSSPGKPNIRRSNDNALASLRATQIIISKPFLPAELLALILKYLAVPDLLRCARVSRKLREMVYDDTRWTQKLKAIGVWNENEARQHVEDAMKRKIEAQRAREADEARRTGARLPGSVNGIAGGGSGAQTGGQVTLFDAGVEEQKYWRSLEQSHFQHPLRKETLTDGFSDLNLSPTSNPQTSGKAWDPNLALNVLDRVKSVRGRAKHEFGKVYGALAPLYMDLARSKKHSDATVFRAYRDPEQQAQILSSLKRFAKCDSSPGWREREEKLDTVMSVFENAVLREFEQGYVAADIDGRMHRYTHVLVTLNGGTVVVDFFISHHPLISRKLVVGMPLDCLEGVAPGHVDLNPSHAFFENLANKMIEQAEVIDRVFPASVDVLTPLIAQLCRDVVAEYLSTLFGEARNKGIETYVKAVAGTFEQALRFVASLRPAKASPTGFLDKIKILITEFYEKRFDRYLADELTLFTNKSDAEVSHWEKEFSEQEASKESFFMSNLINRQAAKRDFLSSFKKVVMMPVNVLPTFNATTKPPPNRATAKLGPASAVRSSSPAVRPGSPAMSGTATPPRPSSPQPEAPATELAAKAAIMNSRLEGIKSLFSIEVALNLTHMAKASIERIALMTRMEGQHREAAKQQANTIFVSLLGVLGDRHVKSGFDKALEHLATYNPREVREELRAKSREGPETTIDENDNVAVEPLVTFLELVNVGDLIQQMLDVFFTQELLAANLTSADDFLNPAVKDKKRFEQMLDERVAAGLNRGIDVLMSEIDFLCATTQLPTDFNPAPTTVADIGPTPTAQKIVTTITDHTSLLHGSTEKTLLDVFTQEIGLRLFGVLCKHFKRQRISVDGAITFISDINHYSAFVSSLKQKPLLPYFQALREMAQIYLVHIDTPSGNLFRSSSGASRGGAKRGSLLMTGKKSNTAAQAKELATIIADADRYRGIFPSEEVYEFAERRADWYLVKADVERALYGAGCSLM